jgi:hydrogenase expression/formation protein HypC
MCLAIPSKVVEIRDKMATIDVSGVRREVSLLLLPEEATLGDYVLVHAGFAIQKIDREAAEEAMKLIEEIEGLRIADSEMPGQGEGETL